LRALEGLEASSRRQGLIEFGLSFPLAGMARVLMVKEEPSSWPGPGGLLLACSVAALEPLPLVKLQQPVAMLQRGCVDFPGLVVDLEQERWTACGSGHHAAAWSIGEIRAVWTRPGSTDPRSVGGKGVCCGHRRPRDGLGSGGGRGDQCQA
jgi:hypothetical protein